MKIEKNRHLEELLMLLEEKDPVTSEQLAQKTMSSVRTVKNDMAFLSRSLEEEGTAKIIAYKAKGYQLAVIDQVKLDAFHKDLLVFNSIYVKRSIIESNRWLFIIQKLLTFDSVKKADLCEELFVSESTLSHDLSEASQFMRSYHLQIDSIPGRGICVAGSEQDKRACMVEVACSSYHDVELLYPVEKFQEMFYDSNETYQKIRHAFLKVLRESEIATTDIASKKLATHLCLLRSRAEGGHYPEIAAAIQDEIKNTYEFTLAGKILEDKTIKEYLGDVPEIETVNFARLLIVNRDIDLRHTSDYSTLKTGYILESSKFFKQVIEFMKTTSYHSFFEMDLYRIYELDYESIFLMIYLKYYFDHTSGHKLITYVERDERLISPVSKDIVRLMIEKAAELFGEPINLVEVQEMSALTDYMLDQVSFQYHKLRLGTACMEGKVIANRIKEKLGKNYDQLIEYNHVYDLYEMRRISFDDYDALIIASGPNLYYAYPVKMIAYDGLSSSYNKKEIFKDLFYSAFDHQYLEQIQKNTNIFRKTRMHDYTDFIDALVFKYCLTDEDQKQQRQHFAKRYPIIPYYYSQSATELVFFDCQYCQKEFVDLYEPEQIVDLDGHLEIHHIIAVCIASDRNVSYLKLISMLLLSLVSDQKNVESLIEKPAETWEQLFYTALEKSFIDS